MFDGDMYCLVSSKLKKSLMHTIASFHRDSSSLEKLEAQVKCPICLEIYQDPKALVCLHTYCKECVQRLVHHRTKDQEVTCPQCRGDVHVEENNVNNLPSVFWINELIDIYNAMKQATENCDIACQSCSGARSIAFCQSCPEGGLFICSSCDSAHRKMKMFASHKVISLSDLRKGSLIHLPTKKTPTCSCLNHSGKIKELYCFTCDKLICRDCTIVDHPKEYGHKYNFVTSVIPELKREVLLSLDCLRNSHFNVIQAAQVVKTVKKEITDQGAQITQDISQFYDKLVTTLEEYKQAVLEKAKTVMNKKLRTLESQQEDLELMQTKYESLINFVMKTVERASDEDLLSVKQSIVTQIQDLAKKCENVVLPPRERANTAVTIPSFDEITDLLCKASVSIVFANTGGEGTNEAMTDTISKLDVSLTTDNYGQPYIADQAVRATLKSLVDNSITQAIVTKKASSVYEVSYTPHIRGRHQLTVRVNNMDVATHHVYVHHPPTKLGTPVKAIQSEGTSLAWRLALPGGDDDIYLTQYRLGHFVHLSSDGCIKHIIKCNGARGIDVDPDTRSVYISGNHMLQKYDLSGKVVKKLGSADTGSHPGEFHEPNGVRFHNNRVYVCDSGNGRVQIFDCNLNYQKSFGTKGKNVEQFGWPEDIDFDTEGKIYVVDSQKICVLVFSSSHQFLTQFDLNVRNLKIGEKPFPTAVRIHKKQMYICDPHQGISVYDISGRFVSSFCADKLEPNSGIDAYSVGIGVDKDGFVYVCQWKYSQIVIY